jgi:prepilin signal peptidase PulO-like enzyme (type II secretory pathway)
MILSVAHEDLNLRFFVPLGAHNIGIWLSKQNLFYLQTSRIQAHECQGPSISMRYSRVELFFLFAFFYMIIIIGDFQMVNLQNRFFRNP